MSRGFKNVVSLIFIFFLGLILYFIYGLLSDTHPWVILAPVVVFGVVYLIYWINKKYAKPSNNYSPTNAKEVMKSPIFIVRRVFQVLFLASFFLSILGGIFLTIYPTSDGYEWLIVYAAVLFVSIPSLILSGILFLIEILNRK